jgi:uncharacterized protein with HEPN domain
MTSSRPAARSAGSHQGSQSSSFVRTEKTIDAVVRNLEVIGEAAKKLPDETRRDIAVDWKRIAGLRDVLIHQYFGIDVEIIWDVVKTEGPGTVPDGFLIPERPNVRRPRLDLVRYKAFVDLRQVVRVEATNAQ